MGVQFFLLYTTNVMNFIKTASQFGLFQEMNALSTNIDKCIYLASATKKCIFFARGDTNIKLSTFEEARSLW